MEKRTILIVDDDIAIGSLEQVILTRAGYAVRRAYSGTEASLFLRANPPDLVLLDLMLPGLSGEELLPQMQGIPVIVVSAKAAVEDNVSTERLFDRFFTVRGARGGDRTRALRCRTSDREDGRYRAGGMARGAAHRPRAFSFGLMTAESRFCGSIGYCAFPWEKRRRIGFFCVLAGGIAICRRLVYTGVVKYKGGLPDGYSEYSRAL